MLPGQASQTKLRTALRRAEHQLLDNPRIFEDRRAAAIFPPQRRLAARSPIGAVLGGHRVACTRKPS
jgi:hypothetical protein